MVSARSEGEHETSRKVKTEFLVQIQGVSNHNDSGVLIIGATNLPWTLDPAMRRRFEKRLYIPLPNSVARFQLLKDALKKEDHQLTDKDIHDIAQRTNLYSGSDIKTLIKYACYEPLRKFQNATHFVPVGKNAKGKTVFMSCAPNEHGAVKVDKSNLKGDEVKKNKITKEDFHKAIQNTKPSVAPKDLIIYEKWTKEFGLFC